MLTLFNSKKTLVISGVIFIFVLVQIGSFAGEDWQWITQLPTQRYDFATAVVDNKVYLIGGTLSKNRRGPFGASTVEVYDPQINTWQRVTDMPTPRAAAKAAVVDGIIYVFGGYNSKDRRIQNWKMLLHIEAYNPQTDTWIQKQDMPVSRVNFRLDVVDRNVYLLGGTTGFGKGDKERMDRVDIYNPATDRWRIGPKMPTRRDTLSVTAISNRIYVIGGYGWPRIPNAAGPFLKVIEEYDSLSRQWRQKNDMLNLKTSFGTVVVRDEIYLIGGIAPEKGPLWYLATVDVYHPQKETWHNIPALPVPMSPYGAEAINGKIYVFGGYNREIGDIPDVLVYDTGFRAVTANDKLFTRWGKLKAAHQR